MTAIAHAAAVALLAVAVLLTLACGVGVAVMRDAWQKLHFGTPPATVSAFLVAAAIALETCQLSASLEALLLALVLTAINGVLSQSGRVGDYVAWLTAGVAGAAALGAALVR